MQIVKSTHSLEVSKSIIDSLPEGLKKYVLAKQAPIISQMPKNEAVKIIDKSILKVIFDLGWNKKVDELEVTEDDRIKTGSDCFDLIKDKYVILTIEELKLSFLNGSLGNYGTFYGLGLKTLSDWLKGYSNDELKKKAMAEFNRLLELVKAKPDLTLEEKEKNTTILCLKFFDKYKNRGMIEQFIMEVDKVCRIYFELLVQMKLINLTKEEKDSFDAKANELYMAKLKQSKLSRQISQFEYESMMTSVLGGENLSVKNIRGKLALLSYFDELILNGKDLNEIIKN